jgi:predicted N-acetyltransferase YhbS
MRRRHLRDATRSARRGKCGYARGVEIQIARASSLSHDLASVIRASIEREFGHVEIVRAHRWAAPTWMFLGFEGAQLVSFLSVVDRDATGDARPLHLLGLNNVITEPAARGRGHARRLNAEALRFMTAQDPSAVGLLFCADDLLAFYGGLGWQPYAGTVIVSQPDGDRPWSSNCMLHGLGKPPPLDLQQIHLRGLPW